MTIRLEVIEAGELDLVPRAKLKEALRRLERDPSVGKPLGGLLRGCRSIRAAGVTNRIVYHELEGDIVEVLAIERRRDSKVYETAQQRLF